jgi:alpha-amylase
VFWKDYFNYDLALRDTPSGIDALVQAHEGYAAGATDVLYLDDNFYIMQRTGYDGKPGLVYVLNNNGDTWQGQWVTTRWSNASFRPVAWWGRNDRNRPEDQSTAADGRGRFFAAPRGYAVYAPK